MHALRSLLASLALSLAAACAPPAVPPEPALWRISDADSEIWLFGTVHVLPANVRWRGPSVSAAFAAADELVTETDTSAEAAAAFPELAARYGALPAGEQLSDRLSAEDRDRLGRIVRTAGLAPEALERQRPWLAALQLSFAVAARKGHNAEAGVETVLAADARRTGKRLSFFETPEQQVRFLADLPPAEEARFLSVTLRQIEEDDALLEAIDRAGARGDVAALGRMLDQQWAESGPVIHERIIIARNRSWADAIAARLAGEGRIFIAVGAAHLVGEQNVVELLRARGISVDGP
jgi:uncharacterized protein YbaP (TraB family)